MKKLEFTHTSMLHLDTPICEHKFSLRILPHDDPAQSISLTEQVVDPCERSVVQADGWGNALLVGACAAAHNYFSYRVSGTAVVDSAKGRGNCCNEAFRYHSPLAMPGPAINALHAQMGAFCADDDTHAVFNRAFALSQLVHDTMVYEPGCTDVSTPAEAAAAQGRGVCQDYAQILVALCRMDGIPARYICGLMWGEGATHAWVEFYDGATWWGVDPTNACEAGDYYIVLARGRDHADCAMERGVFRGGAMQRQITKVSVKELS